MAYHARGFGENALYKILSDHWRTSSPLRPADWPVCMIDKKSKFL
jgi:hypothetical protein